MIYSRSMQYVFVHSNLTLKLTNQTTTLQYHLHLTLFRVQEPFLGVQVPWNINSVTWTIWVSIPTNSTLVRMNQISKFYYLLTLTLFRGLRTLKYDLLQNNVIWVSIHTDLPPKLTKQTSILQHYLNLNLSRVQETFLGVQVPWKWTPYYRQYGCWFLLFRY
jgi:hypothetical protein